MKEKKLKLFKNILQDIQRYIYKFEISVAYNDFSVPCFCVKNDFYLLTEETTNGNRNCLKYCANDGHVCVNV